MKTGFTKRDLETFALILSSILAAMSIRSAMHGHPGARMTFLMFSGTALLIGLFLPILILPVYRLFMFIGRVMGPLISGLLLTIVFYCIFTPIGILLRIFRNDILGLKIDKGRTSYWIERKERVVTPENMENQY